MPPTLHSSLGPSASHRWMNCPASVRLQAEVDTPRSPSIASATGTVAHELVEKVLYNWLWEEGAALPEHFIGEVHEQDGFQIEVDQTMVDGVTLMVTHVWERWSELAKDMPTEAFDGQIHLELPVDLDRLNPPAPMFGTGDVVIQAGDHLEVIDYKNGFHRVEVIDNPQLLYYALASSVTLGVLPETIRCTIVQPNDGYDDPVRSCDYTRDELVAFKHELFAAAEATLDPTTEPVAGKWCRWCAARPVCPAQMQLTVATAQQDFADMTEQQLPQPSLLTDEEIAEVLEKGTLIKAWLKEVESYVFNKLDAGGTVPGWKLTEGVTRRKWIDEDEAEKYLQRKGVKAADRRKTQLVSPAQAEKLLKAAGEDPDKLARFWTKPEGKPRLAPDSDPRPEITASAFEDFNTQDNEK